MTRSRNKAKPVELSEKELGEIAGGGSSYTNSFKCIPDSVSAGTDQATLVADTSTGTPTLKR